MSTVGAPALLEGLIERLASRLRDALRRARRTGAPVLASASAPWPGVHDPLAIARASRRTGEPWFYLEQPARQGAALAALGCVRELAAVGEGRFGALAAAWRELSAGALCDEPAGPAGAGLVALGGFAFHPSGGGSAAWDGFPPASLIVPELALARRADQTWLTLALEVAPDDTGEDLLARAARRLRELREAPLPLLDPAPTGRHRVLSPIPPAHYEEAVARALELIAAGELEKIVLAREVEVHAPADYEAGALLGVLREAFDECFVFAVGRGEAALIGASPELLVRREGQRAGTWRWRGRPVAAPTRRSMTISASVCCAATRTARRTRSSPVGSPARCGRTRSG